MNNSPARANIFMLCLIIYEITVPIFIQPVFFIESLSSEKISYLLIMLNQVVLFVPPILCYMLITRSKLKSFIPIKSIDFKNVVLIIILTFLIQSYSSVITSITSFFFENTVSDTVTDDILNFKFSSIVWAVAIAPAIFEELVFRGIILTNYKALPFKKAIFFSALMFGIMHLNITQFFYTIPVGMFLAFLVYYTGSIYSSMIAHFVTNFSQVLLVKVASILYPSMFLTEQVLTYEDKMSSLMGSIFTAVLTTPFFILFILLFVRHNKSIDVEYRYDLNDDGMCVELDPPNYKTKFCTISFVILMIVYLIYMLATL